MQLEGWAIYEQELFMEDDDLGICGSVDLILFNNSINAYAILDYKTGIIDVEPSSAQIAGYGALFMEKKGISKLWGGVLQNNNDIDAVFLEEKPTRDRVIEIVGNKKCAISGNCRFCKNIVTCPEIEKMSNAFVTGSFNLKDARDMVPVLEAKIDEIKALATEYLKQGFELEGYTLSSRKSKSVDEMGYGVIIERIGIDTLLGRALIKIKADEIIPSEYVKETVTEFAMKKRSKK